MHVHQSSSVEGEGIVPKQPKSPFSEVDVEASEKLLDTWEGPKAVDLAFSTFRRATKEVVPFQHDDNAWHVCGATSVPSRLASRPINQLGILSDKTLNASQAQAIAELYESTEWDFDLFNLAVKKNRGLWYYFALWNQPQQTKIPKGHSGVIFPWLFGIAPRAFPTLVAEATKPAWDGFTEEKEEIVVRGVTAEIHTSQVPLSIEKRTVIVGESLLRYFLQQHFACSHETEKICIGCRAPFLPQTSPAFASVGIVGKFCFSCSYLPNPSHYTIPDKALLRALSIFGVRNYADVFGKVPTAGEKVDKMLAIGFDELKEDEALQRFRAIKLLPLGDKTFMAATFLSWAHLLDAAGLLANMRKGYGGYESIAGDGHHCLSVGERQLCEFLTSNGIKHQKETLYPPHPKLNPSGLMRSDFKAGRVVMEFAGRLADESYAERIQDKRLLAELNGFIFVEVNPSNVDDLSFVLQAIKDSRKRKKP